MSNDELSGQPLTAQPLLPRVKLIWSFVAVTAVALLISIVRWAGEGQALVAAVLALLLWLFFLFTLFSFFFEHLLLGLAGIIVGSSRAGSAQSIRW